MAGKQPSAKTVVAYRNNCLCLGSVLFQPLPYELLYMSLARDNISAALFLCELSKVKQQRQAAIHNEARVAVCLQPLQVALHLRSQPTGTTLSIVEGLT